ncbi:MAG: OmpA family protein [Chitinophagales bacterium]
MNAFIINGDDANSFSANDNFNFNWNDAHLLEPVSDDVQLKVEELKAYLEANPNKQIDIVGLYRSNEVNNTAFPDLGLARANAVKNFFVSKGISSQQLNLSSRLDDTFEPSTDSILHGPLNFSWKLASNANEADSNAIDWEKLAAEIKANPLILYFETGQNTINLSDEQKQKFAQISMYLDKVEGSTVNIIGYTDNTGDRQTNINLGLERANFAKSYFVNNGINADKLNVSSKGPDDPIADNNTEEGRSKNRRTVVTIN